MANQPAIDQSRPLTQQQRRFVEEYVYDPTNIFKAALRAGFAESSAKQQANDLLKDPRIKRAIQTAQHSLSEHIGISKTRVLQEIAKIAFSSPGDVVRLYNEDKIDEVTRDPNNPIEIVVTTSSDGTKTFKSVSYKTVKLSDKIAALEKLGKHLGMFNDRLEVTGKLSLVDLVTQSLRDESNIIDITLDSPQLEDQTAGQSDSEQLNLDV